MEEDRSLLWAIAISLAIITYNMLVAPYPGLTMNALVLFSAATLISGCAVIAFAVVAWKKVPPSHNYAAT